MIDKTKRIICTDIAMNNNHDFKILKDSLLRIRKDTKICVDTGYIGIDKLYANVEVPKKKSKNNPLSKQDKIENRLKSSVRVIVENINAKIKTFKILSEKYRNRRKRFGLRFNLICSLINLDSGFTAS